MIDLYTAATSNGLRAAIGLAESGLRHTVRKIDLSKGEQRAPAFLKLNPAGHIPVIVDHGAARGPLTLTESTAILIYVAEKSGRLLPSEPDGRARVFEALANAMTDVYAPFEGLMHLHGEFGDKVPAEVAAGFDALVRGALTRIDGHLAGSEWVAGAFSIADIAHYCTVWRLKTRLNRTYPDLAHLQRWFAAVASRPGVQLGTSLAGRP
ncbi:MAG: glutathione S-transferase family protein [Alphaproteobacteria bacterium]|nr:glutathione S-transferase family protein [Alphaproteobacteria bacterium]